MKITIDPNAILPTRAHPYDAGLDLYMKLESVPVVIPPYGGSATIDTGVHVQIPQHFAGLVKSKSGLMVHNRIVTDGTVDCNYTGSIHVTLFNHGEFSYTVKPGDKIAQLVIVPCCLPPLEVVDKLEATDRGTNGFGSTGRLAMEEMEVSSPFCEGCIKECPVNGSGCAEWKRYFVKNWNENICINPRANEKRRSSGMITRILGGGDSA